jgi:hypothetical protein
LLVHLAAGREDFRFSGRQLVPGASVRRGKVSVRLQQARFEPGPGGLQGSIRMVIHYPQGGPAFESHRVGLFHRAGVLIDAAGVTYHAAGHDILHEADGGIAVEFRFVDLPVLPVDYTFSYSAPLQLLAVPLSFEIDGLPAPAAPQASATSSTPTR